MPRRIRSESDSDGEIEEQLVSTSKRTKFNSQADSSQSDSPDPLQMIDENKPLIFDEDGWV